MPAPPGNRNNLRHGLSAGSLPRGAGYIVRVTQQFRDALERSVVDQKGELSLVDSAYCQSACRWERHALLSQRWLRREAETLTPDQRLAFSREIARASSERDKCLEKLGLNERPDLNPWDALTIDDRADTHPDTDDGEQNATEPKLEATEARPEAKQ